MGYDGLELACWGDHFEVDKALKDDKLLQSQVGHARQVRPEGVRDLEPPGRPGVCDNIDERHKASSRPRFWGDGKPEGVRQRAGREHDQHRPGRQEARRQVVNGFTGSSIWHLLYSFPPVSGQIDAGYADFAKRFTPILDVFEQEDVYFALEVHPTEIAFDIASAQRAVDAVKGHKRFGFNYDPSHFGYQGVDYVKFIRKFRDRIYHCT